MSNADRDQPVGAPRQGGISRHRWSDANVPATAVVQSVARRADVEPTELDPLYDAIDPEALDALFDLRGRISGSRPRVTFLYAGFEVTVEHDGWLVLSDEFDDH